MNVCIIVEGFLQLPARVGHGRAARRACSLPDLESGARFTPLPAMPELGCVLHHYCVTSPPVRP